MIYYQPGDIVEIRQDIPNKPRMVVIGKITNMFKNNSDKSTVLKGIKCFWFNTEMELQEGIFNTKDLQKV